MLIYSNYSLLMYILSDRTLCLGQCLRYKEQLLYSNSWPKLSTHSKFDSSIHLEYLEIITEIFGGHNTFLKNGHAIYIAI